MVQFQGMSGRNRIFQRFADVENIAPKGPKPQTPETRVTSLVVETPRDVVDRTIQRVRILRSGRTNPAPSRCVQQPSASDMARSDSGRGRQDEAARKRRRFCDEFARRDSGRVMAYAELAGLETQGDGIGLGTGDKTDPRGGRVLRQ